MFGRAFSGESMFQNSLHIYGWSGNDSICIMLSRMHQTIPDCTGTGNNCPEIMHFLLQPPELSCPYFFQKMIGAGFFGR